MLLELKNIKKYYAVRKGVFKQGHAVVRAVDGIDLTIAQGENVSLVGESGCGKTTLGRLILKLMPLDSGNIIFENKDITRLSRGAMRPYYRDIQMVFQDPYNSLDPRFTVRAIIEEAMIFDKSFSKKEREEKIREALVAVKLPGDILGRYPHEFSGGERQRIAIARALIINPKLLILDEAVSSLDVLVQDQIVSLLQDLQKKFNMTYLFISHNLRIVKKISTKIAVMFRGKIVEWAPADELFHNPLHPYTKELLSAAIEYKAVKRSQDIVFKEGGRLIERGPGHFIFE